MTARQSGRLAIACAITGLASLSFGLAQRSCEADAAPATLAETGLYTDFATRTVSADVLSYVPQYPLWSDGATKQRWIQLPPGASIDAKDPDHWVFPVGTKLWKEFSFERRVETRFMQLGADGRWNYATYAWSADGQEARLAPDCGVRNACATPGGTAFDIPSRTDCFACHRGGRNEVLGFGALQLSSDRDPLAPHAEPTPEGAIDLTQLVERGLVRGLPKELVDAPPRIAASTPRARAALGYLHANCGACHNASGPLATLGMVLEYTLRGAAPADGVPPAVATTLGCESRWRCADREWNRVAGGDAEKSLLRKRMGSRHPLLQMPPLASRVVDQQALALVTEWIREDLAPSRCPPEALALARNSIDPNHTHNQE